MDLDESDFPDNIPDSDDEMDGGEGDERMENGSPAIRVRGEKKRGRSGDFGEGAAPPRRAGGSKNHQKLPMDLDELDFPDNIQDSDDEVDDGDGDESVEKGNPAILVGGEKKRGRRGDFEDGQDDGDDDDSGEDENTGSKGSGSSRAKKRGRPGDLDDDQDEDDDDDSGEDENVGSKGSGSSRATPLQVPARRGSRAFKVAADANRPLHLRRENLRSGLPVTKRESRPRIDGWRNEADWRTACRPSKFVHRLGEKRQSAPNVAGSLVLGLVRPGFVPFQREKISC